MRRYFVGVALLVVLSAARADAQRTTQVVRFRVVGVTVAAIHSNAPNTPGALSVVVEPFWSATFSLASTEDRKKVVVALDRPMTDGSVLSISMGAPLGGATAGAVGLGSTGVDALTSIDAGNATSLPLSFALSTPVDSATKDQGNRKVSFTLITGA